MENFHYSFFLKCLLYMCSVPFLTYMKDTGEKGGYQYLHIFYVVIQNVTFPLISDNRGYTVS